MKIHLQATIALSLFVGVAVGCGSGPEPDSGRTAETARPPAIALRGARPAAAGSEDSTILVAPGRTTSVEFDLVGQRSTTLSGVEVRLLIPARPGEVPRPTDGAVPIADLTADRPVRVSFSIETPRIVEPGTYETWIRVDGEREGLPRTHLVPVWIRVPEVVLLRAGPPGRVVDRELGDQRPVARLPGGGSTELQLDLGGHPEPLRIEAISAPGDGLALRTVTDESIADGRRLVVALSADEAGSRSGAVHLVFRRALVGPEVARLALPVVIEGPARPALPDPGPALTELARAATERLARREIPGARLSAGPLVASSGWQVGIDRIVAGPRTTRLQLTVGSRSDAGGTVEVAAFALGRKDEAPLVEIARSFHRPGPIDVELSGRLGRDLHLVRVVARAGGRAVLVWGALVDPAAGGRVDRLEALSTFALDEAGGLFETVMTTDGETTVRVGLRSRLPVDVRVFARPGTILRTPTRALVVDRGPLVHLPAGGSAEATVLANDLLAGVRPGGDEPETLVAIGHLDRDEPARVALSIIDDELAAAEASGRLPFARCLLRQLLLREYAELVGAGWLAVRLRGSEGGPIEVAPPGETGYSVAEDLSRRIHRSGNPRPFDNEGDAVRALQILTPIRERIADSVRETARPEQERP